MNSAIPPFKEDEFTPGVWRSYLDKSHPTLNSMYHFYIRKCRLYHKCIYNPDFGSDPEVKNVDVNTLKSEMDNALVNINQEVEKIQERLKKDQNDKIANRNSVLSTSAAILSSVTALAACYYSMKSVEHAQQTVELTKETIKISQNDGIPYINANFDILKFAPTIIGLKIKFANLGRRPAEKIQGTLAVIDEETKRVLSVESFQIPNDIIPENNISTTVEIKSPEANRKNQIIIIGLRYRDALNPNRDAMTRYFAYKLSGQGLPVIHDLNSTLDIKNLFVASFDWGSDK